jgi:hypothetical protein
MSWLITGSQPFTANALLDQFPGAAAAYSLRNLVGTSNPNVVRVRRSSDNTEQDFTAAQVTDGTLTTFCGAGDGFVRAWYDQSGNQEHLGQSTAATQPQLVSSGAVLLSGSRPSLQYSGSKTLSRSVSFTLNGKSQFSVVTVAYPTQGLALYGINSCLYFAEAGGWGAVFQQVATNGMKYRFGAGLPFNSDRQVSTTLTAAISQTYKEGASESYRLNGLSGESTATSSATIVNTSQNFYLGFAEGSSYFQGSISEAIVYLGSVRQLGVGIEANINAHYAIY